MAVSIETMASVVPSVQLEESAFIDHTTGDFAGRDYAEEILPILNHCGALYMAHTETVLPDALMANKEELDTKLTAFAEYVNNPDNYEPGAAERIRARYKAADALLPADASPVERLAARMDPQNTIFVVDVDGTLTDNPDEYLGLIPVSEHVEPLLEDKGRDYFGYGFVRGWQPFLRTTPTMFGEAGKQARPLDGTNELFEKAQAMGATIMIDSANFMPVVERFLEINVPASRDMNIPVFAITHDNTTSAAKDLVLTHIALSNPEATVIYIGDGSSCKDAVKAKQFVAFYLARKGLGLEKVLEAEKAPYGTYETHHDTITTIESAEQLRNQPLVA